MMSKIIVIEKYGAISILLCLFSFVGISMAERPDRPVIVSVELQKESFTGGIIFHDDFETISSLGDRYTDYDSHGGDFIVVSSGGLGGSSRCLKASWRPGQVSAGNLIYMFGRNPIKSQINNTIDYDEIYWRFYVKTMKGWSGNPEKLTRATVFAANNWSQAMIAHLWGEGNDLLLTMDPATGIDSRGRLATGKYNDFDHLEWLGLRKGTDEIYETSSSGQWLCIEIHIRLNTPGKADGVFEFWIDEKLQARRDDLNWIGTWREYGINAIMLENYWNDGSPTAQSRFLDNFTVSTKPVGMGYSPGNPLVFKGPFEDPDDNDVQSTFECQVSSVPGTSEMVWTGKIQGRHERIRIDMINGSFMGTLSGEVNLLAGTYYARVRQADREGNLSEWSAWKKFKTKALSRRPAAPDNLRLLKMM